MGYLQAKRRGVPHPPLMPSQTWAGLSDPLVGAALQALLRSDAYTTLAPPTVKGRRNRQGHNRLTSHIQAWASRSDAATNELPPQRHERMSAMMRRSLGEEVLMKQQPTLFLTVGLPCTGKTTAARRIEIEQQALRLTKDEWVKALYGHEDPPPAQNVIEGRLIQIGLRVLELGTSVVLDYGLWGRDERSALRQAAADLGAVVEMRYFELAPAEQRRRLEQRQAEAPHTTWPMSAEELAEWAANIDIPTLDELDGSEPIDDPPAGFATWDEWRRYRWPPSVS
jgi:predicted kinase